MGGMTESTGAQRRPSHARPWTGGRLLRVLDDTLHVRRAFGEPVVQGDVVLVPVARIVGAGGLGHGSGESTGAVPGATGPGAGSGSGGGGGLGLRVHPVGAYVVRGSDVTWQPAFDLSRVALRGQVVGVAIVVALAVALRRRRR